MRLERLSVVNLCDASAPLPRDFAPSLRSCPFAGVCCRSVHASADQQAHPEVRLLLQPVEPTAPTLTGGLL